MGLSEPVTLPVSALNIGVASAIPGIQAEVTELSADVSDVTASIDLATTVHLNPPNPTAFGGALAAHLLALPGAFAPAKWITANAGFSEDIGVKLGIVDGSIALVGKIAAKLQLGINAGGLQTYTYSGGVAKFAGAITAAMGRDDRQVQGFVIACESFDSWGRFSLTFNTGKTVSQGQPLPSESKFTLLGNLTGGELNTGLLQVQQPINLYLAHLNGLRAVLQANLDLSLGLNLPDVSPLIAQVEAAIPQVELMMENLVNVKIDPTVEIRGINLRTNALLKLIGDLNLSLSGGGLTYWSYTGVSSGLGLSLAITSTQGLPGGSGPEASINAMIVLCESPSSFADFGLVFGGGS